MNSQINGKYLGLENGGKWLVNRVRKKASEL